MRDVILICAMLAIFGFGYFIMKKVDAFIGENQQAIAEERRKNRSLIQLAAETPALVDSVAPAMEFCAWSNPCIGFAVSTGSPEQLLQRLRDGSLDLLLLPEDRAQALRTEFLSLPVPCGPSAAAGEAPAENAVCVLWNQRVPSPNRDRVVFALSHYPPVLDSGA